MDKPEIKSPEKNSEELISGPIPPLALMVAEKQGISADEIWGSYFPPDDNRNPNMGNHYLGLVSLSASDVRVRITKEKNRVLPTDSQKQWLAELDALAKYSEPELNKLFEVGIGAVKTHELTHKKQQDLLKYQSSVLKAYWVINTTKDELTKSEVRENYQDLVLLAEVQALSAQCSAETKDVDVLKKFNIYWFSKTFKLFNQTITKNYVPQVRAFDPSSGKIDVEYGSKDITFFEDIYNSIRNKQDFDPKISNVYGLMSRALYLCENPAQTLSDIRSGKLSYKEFEGNVLNGLQKMIDSTSQDIVERGKQVLDQTQKPLGDKAKQLESFL